MGKLEGKVAAITGGNSGLGLAIAKRFKAEGASVAIFGRNSETLESAVSDIGGNTISSLGDVRSISDLDVFSVRYRRSMAGWISLSQMPVVGK